jgi:hypothetical protein
MYTLCQRETSNTAATTIWWAILEKILCFLHHLTQISLLTYNRKVGNMITIMKLNRYTKLLVIKILVTRTHSNKSCAVSRTTFETYKKLHIFCTIVYGMTGHLRGVAGPSSPWHTFLSRSARFRIHALTPMGAVAILSGRSGNIRSNLSFKGNFSPVQGLLPTVYMIHNSRIDCKWRQAIEPGPWRYKRFDFTRVLIFCVNIRWISSSTDTRIHTTQTAWRQHKPIFGK